MKTDNRGMKALFLSMIPLVCSLMIIQVESSDDKLCFKYPVSSTKITAQEFQLCSSKEDSKSPNNFNNFFKDDDLNILPLDITSLMDRNSIASSVTSPVKYVWRPNQS